MKKTNRSRSFELDESYFGARGKYHVNGIESFWSFVKCRLAKFNGWSDDKFLLHLKNISIHGITEKMILIKLFLIFLT